jgi:CBS domain-containing protein
VATQAEEIIRDIMSPGPVTVPSTCTLTEAARHMREGDIGDVIVADGDRIIGIVTDRDIVVRAVAEGKDPDRATVGDICSSRLVTVAPDDTVSAAIQLIRTSAVRRLPVTDDGRLVGVVTLGDLALEWDPNSALADVTAAEPNV